MHRVSVVGLGVMGENMARRLLRSGCDVTVFNRSSERAERLRPIGARLAASPAEAAAASDVTIISVFDDEAVLQVALGADGLLDGARPNAVIVDCSTVAPATDIRVGAALSGRGVRCLDAPVTGGAEAAERGSLTLLCGGAEEDLERAAPVLRVIGNRIFHMGPIGSGQASKIVNQVVLAGALLGVAEGMTLADAFHLNLELVIEALKEGAAASWVLSHRAVFMARNDFPPRGRLALHLKDLDIALASAQDLGVQLPGAILVRGLEEQLAKSGYADRDLSILVQAIRPQAPQDLRGRVEKAQAKGELDSG